jgi:ABC-type antimicrobial peptide transport system permease subunit
LGIGLAAAAARLMRSTLFGFTPFDLTSYAAGLLLFAVVAVAASVLPVRRALRVDPASALRYE